MSEQPLIKLRGVSIGYGALKLVEGIDLEVRDGDFCGLVGPNGAGKSTLLKVILGNLPPLAGKVWRRPGLRLGYVPQRTLIDPIFPLTALEVVRSGGMGPKAKGQGGHLLSSASRDAALASLNQVGVGHLASRPLRDLSGGQQQRVLIARALVRQPDLLILDEPAAGMDLPAEKDLLDFVTDLNRHQGTNVVLVVHQISLVAGRATKMALINKDLKLFAMGSAEEMLSSERLSDLYDHPMDVIEADGSVLVRPGTTQREEP